MAIPFFLNSVKSRLAIPFASMDSQLVVRGRIMSLHLTSSMYNSSFEDVKTVARLKIGKYTRGWMILHLLLECPYYPYFNVLMLLFHRRQNSTIYLPLFSTFTLQTQLKSTIAASIVFWSDMPDPTNISAIVDDAYHLH